MYVSVCMHRNWIACCTSSLVDATERRKKIHRNWNVTKSNERRKKTFKENKNQNYQSKCMWCLFAQFWCVNVRNATFLFRSQVIFLFIGCQFSLGSHKIRHSEEKDRDREREREKRAVQILIVNITAVLPQIQIYIYI